MMKFVFVGPNSPSSRVLVRDLIENNKISYVENPTIIKSDFVFSKLLKILYRTEFFANGVFASGLVFLLCSGRINRIVDTKYVYVYFHPWISTFLDVGFIDKIRKNNPNSLHVALFYDSKIMDCHNIKRIKQKYDLVAIHDSLEAEKNDIAFIHPVYSKRNINFDMYDEIYDLSFVGKAKDRFDILIAIYDYLEEAGLKCNFFIHGVPRKKRKYRKGIVYSNKEISIEEADEYIWTSKCLLDLKPYGTTALTSRHREAVLYNKKLLSNNETILSDKYYNNNMMQYFEKIEDIDISFWSKEKYNYQYEGDYKADNLLIEIQKKLSERAKNGR